MKITFYLAIITLMSLSSNAQRGNNQVQIAAELAIPAGEFADAVQTGFGVSAKGLLGLGSAGQFSLTSGYTGFQLRSMAEYGNSVFSIIPILAGYRHNFNGFYVEPQLGVAIYNVKYNHATYYNDSETGFTWGGGIGYIFKRLDIGARYQNAKIKHEDFSYSLVGIHVGYNISL